WGQARGRRDPRHQPEHPLQPSARLRAGEGLLSCRLPVERPAVSLELFETNWLAQLEIAIKVVIAGAFGGIVGLERELANRPAGLRTHALLAAAAALLVGLGDLLIERFAEETPPYVLRTDPLRIIEAIVTGVAF